MLYILYNICYIISIPELAWGRRGAWRTRAQAGATLGDPSEPSSLERGRPRRLKRAQARPGGENRARGGPSRPNLVEKGDFGSILGRFFMDFGAENGSETA